jgi:hypothetical protein
VAAQQAQQPAAGRHCCVLPAKLPPHMFNVLSARLPDSCCGPVCQWPRPRMH